MEQEAVDKEGQSGGSSQGLGRSLHRSLQRVSCPSPAYSSLACSEGISSSASWRWFCEGREEESLDPKGHCLPQPPSPTHGSWAVALSSPSLEHGLGTVDEPCDLLEGWPQREGQRDQGGSGAPQGAILGFMGWDWGSERLAESSTSWGLPGMQAEGEPLLWGSGLAGLSSESGIGLTTLGSVCVHRSTPVRSSTVRDHHAVVGLSRPDLYLSCGGPLGQALAPPSEPLGRTGCADLHHVLQRLQL